MYAQRLDHDHNHDYDHDAPEPASSLDLSRRPDNDNAHTRSPEGDEEATLSVEGIVPRGPSRRVRYVIAAVFASLSLSAYAFTRPPRAARQDAPPPVTQVDIAARAMPVPEAPTSELIVPDAPSRRAPRGDHAHHETAVASPHETSAHETSAHETSAHETSAHETTAVAAEAPATQPATTREEPPLARLVMHQEALPTEAQPAEAPRGETPAAADDGEEHEEALPTDSADEVVEAAVNAHSSEIEECINNAPDEAEGRLTVSLVIARDGAVRSAAPHAPEALRSVGQCIAHAMRGWRMAVPDASGDTSITWPFEVESNR